MFWVQDRASIGEQRSSGPNAMATIREDLGVITNKKAELFAGLFITPSLRHWEDWPGNVVATGSAAAIIQLFV